VAAGVPPNAELIRDADTEYRIMGMLSSRGSKSSVQSRFGERRMS
jgi:hypothetical protein